ncbi:hypothetical protein P175DRAFT_021624 [Aspergillus ochraceoroseus IBT 24754]|uniref:Uncharacterized protein n=1 Tax=Aspergillus ochraceoroseus IBT 24754 TaxID=1392256 RepID=A0A2T5M6J5_9EURO|nr:uncharacterized protein P175DRAFT_021624 [Aspergillus ochraceoroseus IBT 24754]PTU24152.1 hypothetical protein P175DRAFT_021624 [Aspergillus ochraceoroseus IBT 24754]
MISFISLAILISPVLAYSRSDVVCIYQLSGQYAPLQRALFYLLLAFGVLGRRQRWLVAGALASAMTYGGAAALHSILLLAEAPSSVVDLDIYGVFAITSTGLMLTAPLLAWSTTLRSMKKEIRMLVLLWAILIFLGAVFATAAIYIKGSVQATSCISSLDAIPSGAPTLESVSGNCTYVCFPENHPLFRSPGDIQPWENKLDDPRAITGMFVPTIAASIPSAIITWIWSSRQGRAYDYTRLPTPLNRLELGWIGDRLFAKQQHNRGSFSPESPVQVHRHPKLWRVFQYYVIIGSFGVFVVNIVLNEVRLRPLPTDEMPYAVGQWSPWVAVGLIVLAQVLSQLMKKIWPQGSQEQEEKPHVLIRHTDEGAIWTEMNNVNSAMRAFRREAPGFRRRNSF